MYYIDSFLNHLEEKRYSKSTIKTYYHLLKRFAGYFKNIPVKEITLEEILKFLSQFESRINPSKYYYINVIRLCKYFKFLEKKNIIFISPLHDYKKPKFLKQSYPDINKTKIETIMDNIKTDSPILLKGKAILELAYSSALRPREIYNLKITDIDFNKGLLFIENSKNKKDRIVPAGNKALYWVKKYITEIRPRYYKNNNHNYVFINHKTGEKLTVWGIRWAIRETLRQNNINPIKTYSLRSTSATAMLSNGMSVIHISKLLGHVELRTTQTYLRLKKVQLKKVLDEKHPRNQFEILQGGKTNEVW